MEKRGRALGLTDGRGWPTGLQTGHPKDTPIAVKNLTLSLKYREVAEEAVKREFFEGRAAWKDVRTLVRTRQPQVTTCFPRDGECSGLHTGGRGVLESGGWEGGERYRGPNAYYHENDMGEERVLHSLARGLESISSLTPKILRLINVHTRISWKYSWKA